MNVTMFLILLAAFAVLSSLITEGIKNLVKDKENLPTNIVAIVVGLLVGGIGTGFYYVLNDIVFTDVNVIYLILMGLASGLTAMVGYDKTKESVLQIAGIKTKKE